jgi:hypothetical protein
VAEADLRTQTLAVLPYWTQAYLDHLVPVPLQTFVVALHSQARQPSTLVAVVLGSGFDASVAAVVGPCGGLHRAFVSVLGRDPLQRGIEGLGRGGLGSGHGSGRSGLLVGGLVDVGCGCWSSGSVCGRSHCVGGLGGGLGGVVAELLLLHWEVELG